MLAGDWQTAIETSDVNEARSGRGRGRGQEHEGEAKAEASSHEVKANSDEAEAKIALIFQPNFTLWSHFSKNRNFRSIFDGPSKISAQNGL